MERLLILILSFATLFVPLSGDIETVHGTVIIDDPLVIELLSSPILQRLQHIDQSGIPHYFGRVGAYSRYIHSVGVYHLLKRFGASRKEQIAGLLHDTSHTVFSHTGDWFFGAEYHQNAYQDSIQGWFFEQQNIEPLLAKYQYTIADVLAKNSEYKALDQELPDLCADRLEYNLFTGHLLGLITTSEIEAILDDISFDGMHWYFSDPVIAVKFSTLSLYFTEHLFTPAWNVALNELTARMMKRALELHLITYDDIHFGIDLDVLVKLKNSNDLIISHLWQMCEQVENSYEICDAKEADYSCFCKFRGIDPLISFQGRLVRLSSLDNQFLVEYLRVKDKVRAGVHLKWHKNILASKPLLTVP